MAVPVDNPVTTPLLTLATALSFVDHTIFWLVALVGNTVAINVLVSPMLRVKELLFKETPVTLVVVLC